MRTLKAVLRKAIILLIVFTMTFSGNVCGLFGTTGIAYAASTDIEKSSSESDKPVSLESLIDSSGF